MAKTLTARLDKETQEELVRLSKATGKTESEIVREGIRLLAANQLSADGAKPRFHGLGQFASGKSDLASDKKHLQGFGR